MSDVGVATKPDIGDSLSSTKGTFEDTIKQSMAEQQAKSAEFKRDIRQPLETVRKVEKESAALTPPEPVAMPPKPELKFRDPSQAFGSAASWLAVFGSFLTKRPLTTALNASANVMNAWHQGDIQNAQFALKEWQAQVQEAQNLHKFQMDAYNGALAKLKDRRADAVAELQSLAAAFKDDTATQLIQARMFGELQRLIDARDKMQAQIDKNGPAQWEASQRQKLFEGLQTARQSGDPTAIANAAKALDDFNRAFPKGGGATIVAAQERGAKPTAAQQKAETQQKDAAGVVGQMKELLDIIDKSPKAVAGVAGMMSRIGETLETAPVTRKMFAPAKGPVDLSAHDFSSKLELLKAQLPALLAKTGRISNYERSQIDAGLQALERGSTDAIAKQSIENAIKIISEKFGLKGDGTPDPSQAVVEEPPATPADAEAQRRATDVLNSIYGIGGP